MTAQIVWLDDRSPMSTTQILELGPEVGSTKLRADLYPDDDPETQPAPGQLWEREAERDVQAHGEPVVVDLANRALDLIATRTSRQQILREFVTVKIERRRPAMRARRV